MKNESGNILIIILIAIFLLGTLTAMLTRSGSSTNETGSYEQESIKVSNILKYATAIEQGVTLLRQRGCSENQLSFQYDADGDNDYNDNDETPDYYNANAPTDLSCHIFRPEGAGVTYQQLNETWLDSDQSAQDHYGEIYVPTNTCIDKVGSDKTSNCNVDADPSNDELVLFFPWITESLCIEINNRMGVTNPSSVPPTDIAKFYHAGMPAFTGTVSTTGTVERIDSGSDSYTILDEKKSGCLQSNHVSQPPTGTYHFYHTLIAR